MFADTLTGGNKAALDFLSTKPVHGGDQSSAYTGISKRCRKSANNSIRVHRSTAENKLPVEMVQKVQDMLEGLD